MVFGIVSRCCCEWCITLWFIYLLNVDMYMGHYLYCGCDLVLYSLMVLCGSGSGSGFWCGLKFGFFIPMWMWNCSWVLVWIVNIILMHGFKKKINMCVDHWNWYGFEPVLSFDFDLNLEFYLELNFGFWNCVAVSCASHFDVFMY